ncbi:hypothetical protein DPMN_059599 [Dreissena polymorpha]|uniref:Uncharacterized protein n=1 Tax=Dreissena polymorpha TaxID=45954 RepID=A0A9D4HGT5_DREPO|nr:hypothetical protein DPMN_059599 [Dreissena polymorpha]
MESCSCFTDGGSVVCIRSFMVIQNAAEISEAVTSSSALPRTVMIVSLDAFVLEHLAFPSVSGEACSS